MKLYMIEHPDFTAVEAFEALLAMGGEDVSWRNDLSPSVELNGFRIWVSDFDEETAQFLPDPVFYLARYDDGGELLDDFTLDSIDAVKAHFAGLGL